MRFEGSITIRFEGEFEGKDIQQIIANPMRALTSDTERFVVDYDLEEVLYDEEEQTMAEKTFDYNFHLDVNDAWCGSAYFVKADLSRTHIVSHAAVPGGKANTSKARIKESLDETAEQMKQEGWIRVSREEMYKCEKAIRAAKQSANN